MTTNLLQSIKTYFTVKLITNSESRIWVTRYKIRNYGTKNGDYFLLRIEHLFSIKHVSFNGN